jgi:putative ABC transport system permease protein
MTIVGVVPDFHQRSLHHRIEPLVFMPFYGTHNPLSVRIAGEDVAPAVALIKSSYDRFFPGNAFEFRFVDQFFQKQYEADRQFGQVLSFFTVVAIFIAVLGLFGLAAFSFALRTKEVGIRKVLGASVVQLIRLLSGDFLRLVLIALSCGLPLAWYGIRLWLSNFAYEQKPAWWIFLATALLVFLLAFATISIHALRAAYRNPVEALRNE